MSASIAALFAVILPQTSHATSDTWTGATDSLWSNPANWLGGNVPGGSSDIATFNSAGNGNTTINVGSITLGTLLISGLNAAGYTFGPSVGSGTITFGNGGAIAIDSLSPNAQTINANVVLGTDASAASFQFLNNSAALLTVAGGITGATGGAKTLTVTGNGNTVLTGIIGNGTAASLALAKQGNGTLTVSAANTFSGGVSLTGGTLRATTDAGALGAGALTLGGGVLELANNTNLSFGRNTTVTADTQITSDRLASGAGTTHTLGTLSIGAQILSIAKGANVSSGTAGVTFGSVTLTGNATFTAAAGTLLTLGAITNGSNSMTFDGDGDITINGSTGPTTTGSAGTTIKNGNGTLRFTADPNTTGLMTINGGVVEYNTGGADDHPTTINNGGTLRTLTGAVGDSQTLTINTGGTWDVRATDTIGQLVGSGLVTKGTSGSVTISLNSGTSSTFSGTIQNGSGTIALTKTNTSTVTLSGTNTYTGATTVNRGTLNLDFSAAGAPSSNILYNGVTAGGLTFNAGSNTATAFLTVTGQSSGATTVNSQAFGNVSITGGVNTITATSGSNNTVNVSFGTFTRSTGTTMQFVAPASGQFTTTQSDGYMGGGYLYTKGGATSLTQVQGGVIGLLNKDAFYTTGANIGSLPGVTTSSNLIFDRGSSGDVLFTGTTQINSITASDATSARTINGGAGGTLVLGSAGAVLLTNLSLQIGVAGSGGALTAGTTGAAELFLHNVSTGTLTVNAAIQNNAGGGAVAVTTNGRTVFNGNNTYTGATTITTGNLLVTNSGGLGTAAGGTTVYAGAALEMSGGITLSDALTLSSAGISNGGGLRNISGDNTYAGVITIGGTARINSDSGNLLIDSAVATALVGGNNTFSLGGAGNIIIRDAFTHGGTSNPTLTKDGTGMLTLEGANTFTGTGTFTLNDGVVRITNGAALGGTTAGTTVTDNAALELSGGISTDENVTLDNSIGVAGAGAIRSILGSNTMSGTVTVDNGTGRIAADTGASLTFSGTLQSESGGSRTANITGAGTITISGAANDNATPTNRLSITKDGTGTLILSGTNNYTGGTTVNAGTLRLDYGTNNTSKLADTNGVLTLGGGTVEMTGGSHTEVVTSTALTAGTSSTISRIDGSSVLALNAIAVGTGAALNITGNNIASTDNLNIGGILGGGVTVTVGGVKEWATNSTNAADGLITALTTFTDIARLGSVINDTPNGVVRIVETGSTSGNITLSGATVNNIGSLKMTAVGTTSPASAAATIDTASKTLRLSTDGGIWLTDGANALTIGTAASSGTLTAGGTATNIAGALTFINDSLTNDITVNAIIANNGGGVVTLTKNGVGRLVLNGANTSTGAVTILGGTLHVGALTGASTTATLGAGVAVTNNGTLIFRRTNTTAVDLAGSIGGTGSVSYVGDGTSGAADFTINSASTYTGGTTVDRARANVSAGTTTAFGTSTVTVLAGGSVFVGGTITLTNNFVISGDGWLESSGRLGAIRLGTNSITGTVTLAGNSRITASNSTTGSMSGVISGDFNLEFGEDSATGTITLSGNNTYTGTTAVSFGNLKVVHANALGTAAGGTTVATGATLQLQNNITVTGEALTLSGDGFGGGGGALRQIGGDNTWSGNITINPASVTRIASDAGSLTISGNIALSTTASDQLVFQGDGGGIVSGTISGASRVTRGQIGTGMWILSGDNTYTGQTLISNGTLSVSSLNKVVGGSASSSLGAPTTVADGTINIGSVAAGTNAVLRYTGAGETTDRVISLTSDGVGSTSAIQNDGTGALIFTSNFTASGTNARTFFLGGSNGGSILGNIVQGAATTTLAKQGNGTWILAGTNTYTGGTNLSGGVLELGSAQALGGTGTLASVGLIQFTGGTLRFTAANTTDYSSRFGTTGAFYFFDTNGQTVTFNSPLVRTSGFLSKIGAGTLELAATGSNLTGGITVGEGTLLVTGSLSGATTLVTDDAILGGTGSVAGVTVQSGGTLAPGTTGKGTLSTGSLFMSSSLSRLSLEIGKSTAGSAPVAGSDYDSLSVTGLVDLNGDLTLTLGAGVEENDVFTLILNDGVGDAVLDTFVSVNGVATNLGQGSVFSIGGQYFAISYRAEGGVFDAGAGLGNDVAIMAVPEPGAVGSLVSSLGLLLGLQRFRRRRV